MNPFYAFCKFLMSVALRIYFRNVRIEGLENVPKNEPLLVTPNHQNAVLDPLLAGSLINIPLHFLTRQDAFVWWSKPILKLLNMMPIYRIRDGYAKLSQNDAVFETCKQLFKENKSVLIFPEGNHGENHYLRPITKGAARIALFSQQQMDKELKVLPVGLNYFDHHHAQSGVVIVYGKPFSIKPFADEFEEIGVKALLKCREAISNAMKETLVIPDETEDYVQKKNAIFQEKNIGLSFDELRNFPYQNEDVPPKKERGKIARLLNPIPFLIIKRMVSNIKDVVFYSSTKFAVGLFAFPIWWAVVYLLLSFVVGTPIALLAVFVMVFGLFYSYS